VRLCRLGIIKLIGKIVSQETTNLLNGILNFSRHEETNSNARKILLFSDDYRYCQRFNRSHKELSTSKYAIRMRITRKILHNTIDNVINVYKCLKIYETERERERERI